MTEIKSKSEMKRLASMGEVDAVFRYLEEVRSERDELRAKLAEAEKALDRIWTHPNSKDHHHPDECELRKVDPEDQDDEVCTCGYWSASYPELKLTAREALAKIRGEK